MLLGCKGYVLIRQDHGSYTSPGNLEITLKSERGYSTFQRPRLKMKPKSTF